MSNVDKKKPKTSRKSKKLRRERRRQGESPNKQHLGVRAPPHAGVPVQAEWLPAEVDPQLWETAKTQWQFGDWQALVKLSARQIEAHPERANLAMLCAAAHQQLGQLERTREMMHQARQWGASKELVVRVLAGGVHNVLGRVAAVNEDSDRALDHFRHALSLDRPMAIPHYLVKARASAELEHFASAPGGSIGLASWLDGQSASRPSGIRQSNQNDALLQQSQNDWCQGAWQRLARLDNATLPEHPQRIMLGIYAACGHQQLGDGEAEQRCVSRVQAWGGQSGKIKRFLLSGIYNRLARASALLDDHDEALAYFHKSFTTVSGDIKGAECHIQSRISSQLADMPEADINAILNKLKR